jgi:hypothetical protein
MGTFADISSDLARWYGQRLKYLWTTSVNEGLGFFVAYAALVVTAAILARQSIHLRNDDEGRLDQFLQSDHQTRDADRFVSALSVVLSALPEDQRIRQGTCPPGSDECRRARNVLTASVQFAKVIADHEDLSTEGPVDSADIATILSSDNLPRDAAAIAGRALDSGVASLNGISTLYSSGQISHFSDASARACDADPDVDAAEGERLRRNQFGLVVAVCQQEARDVSALQIPEQVAEFVSSDSAESNSVARRMRHAIGVSFALEAALRAGIFQLKQARTDTCPCCSNPAMDVKCAQETHSFTASYFISVDSVLRYWREDTMEPVKRLPKNILWAAREYFTTYLAGDTQVNDEYVSRPYIDIAGAGIVQTICRAVATQIPKHTSAIGASNDELTIRIDGIVCADLALRLSAVISLVEAIQKGPLVYAGLVRIHANGEALVEPEPNNGPMDELKKLIESVQWDDVFTREWASGPASRGTTRLQVESQIWYVVPIARTGSDVLAIVIQPAPSSGVGRLARWAILGSICGAALVLLTFTAHQSRRVAIAGRDLARLRGLPAAVIECRSDPAAPEKYSRQFIVTGNDRAEEVLQIQLPNFGLTDGAQPQLGSIFYENKLIPADLYGVEPQDRIASEGEIYTTRRRGEISTYYARLKERRNICQLPLNSEPPTLQWYKWVRVAAGPVILPRWRGTSLDATGRLESTLAIIVPVFDETLVEKLDKVIEGQARKG